MLKGIETQTMVTRTSDFVRDVNAQNRKNDLSRDFQAVQTQNVVEQEGQQVTQTLNSQEARIKREKEERGRRGRQGQLEAAPEEFMEDEPAEEIPPYIPSIGNYFIDVKI